MKNTRDARSLLTFKPSTLQILSALMSEHQWLDLIADEYQGYQNLIDEVHHLANRDSYDKLSIQGMSKRTGYKTTVVTRFIHKVYQSIWALNETQPELFKGPGFRYDMLFISDDQTNHSYFTLWLEVPLNYSDQFEWHFMRAKQQSYTYYVDHIKHEISGGEAKTTVTLRSGRFNSYRKMLYDKACFYDLLSIDEKFHLSEHEIDRLLIHRVEQDRDGYPDSLAYLEKKIK